MVKISVCYITRNSEQYLNESMASIKPIAHEIIVVDDNSTDKTLEICKKYDAKVISGTFNGDKKKQRNKYLKEATGDWILVVDSDEVYHEDEIWNLLKHMDGEYVSIRYPFYTFWKKYDQVITGHMWSQKYERCFKNMKGLKYDIHHMVSDSKDRMLNGCSCYRDKVKHVEDVHVYHYSMMPPDDKIRAKIKYYMLRDNPNVNDGNVEDFVNRHPYFSNEFNQPRYGSNGLYVAGMHDAFEEKVIPFKGSHPKVMIEKVSVSYMEKANKYMEEHWQFHNHLDHDRHQERLRYTAEHCIGKTLEVGCANGFSTYTMQHHNKDAMFSGVEPTDWGYQQARKNYPQFRFFKEMGENLSAKDGEYNTVLLSEIIEHVADPRRLADEAWRVCNKRMIVTTPTKMHPDPDHKRFYSIEDMTKFLNKYGTPKFDGLTEKGERATRTEDIYFQIAWVDKC